MFGDYEVRLKVRTRRFVNRLNVYLLLLIRRVLGLVIGPGLTVGRNVTVLCGQKVRSVGRYGSFGGWYGGVRPKPQRLLRS